jgi:hypothetical protein
MQPWRSLFLMLWLSASMLAMLPPHPHPAHASTVVGACDDLSAPYYFTGDDFVVLRNLSFSGEVRPRDPEEPPFVGVMRLKLNDQTLYEVSGGPGSHLTIALEEETVSGLEPKLYNLFVESEHILAVTPASLDYPSYFHVGTTIRGTVFDDFALNLEQTITSVCVTIPEGSSLSIANKLFQQSGHLNLASIGNAGSLTVRDSVFASPFNLPELSSGELTLEGNLFEREVLLTGRSRITFKNNQLLKPLLFQGAIWAVSGKPPVIEGNSFVGQYALVYDAELAPAVPIALGANYYGDANGPDLGGAYYSDYFVEQQAIFRRNEILRMRGAEVTRSTRSPFRPITTFFDLAPHLKIGTYNAPDRRVFPTFTLNGVHIAQHVMQHNTTVSTISQTLRQQRESLLTVDLAVDDRDVTGAELRVHFNGQQLQPVIAPHRLQRDSALYGSMEIHQRGYSTFNFILPPVSTSLAHIQIYLDTSNISGYRNDQGRDQLIYEFSPAFYGSCKRKFNIAILPVELKRWGYPQGAPDGVAMQQSLLNLLPAMFPILPAELNIQVLPTYTNRGVFLPSVVVMQQLIFKAGTYRKLWQVTGNMADADETLDIIVVVVKPGALNVLWNKVDGANHWSNRQVLLVVEGQSEAAIHELGHAFGLYLSEEQYDRYPDFGIPVTGLTAFLPDAGLSLGQHAADLQLNRLRHYPQVLASETHVAQWYDVMGAETRQVWPIAQTLATFSQQLYFSRCSNPASTAERSSMSAPLTAAQATPTRTLAIWGEVGYAGFLDQYWMPQLRVVPGSLEFLEITPVANGRLVGEHACTTAMDAACGDGYGFADLFAQFFDQAGNEIHTELAYLKNRDLSTQPGQRDSFFVTLSGIPDQATRVVFKNRNGVNPEEMQLADLALNSVGELELEATAHGAGVQLSWTTEQPPRNELLLISNDQGSSWRAFGFVSDGSAWVPPFAHQPGDQPALAVLAGNGLGASLSRPAPLAPLNFAPSVRILSPLAEDQAHADTVWMLTAQAHDAEDGLITTGVWSSSLQGRLGTSSTLTTTLQAGTHTLSYQVSDSQGAGSTAQVRVHVGTTAPTALVITPQALSLAPAYRSDASATSLELTAATSYTARLELRNQGYALEGNVRVRLGVVGAEATSMLLEQAITLAPFGSATLAFPLGPFNAAQSYRLEAQFVTATAPQGSTEQWTSWTLNLSSAAPNGTWRVFLPLTISE